ncbi:MAG: NUDIX domain-containing protein, partial [Sulfuritalea sp.]|nr:NUDIX domain-containing protein [Sulfuritalea sp.]
PELPPGADSDTCAELRFGCRVIGVAPAPTLVHGFSHFRLHIAPLLLRVQPHHCAMGLGRQWLDLAATADAALPAPIRTILADVHTSGSRPLLSRKR